ncbi:MAG: tRNA pseudouridine(38-40) synthase TruA [Candidatus Omnitrophica bacterium]|nr:tRNA pseudouridine(38-40) synthase TruA [Candidatus Omnitrophota bacterium]
MRNIKITIEYDGTDFQGWQIQKKKERTIQDEIKKSLHKIFGKALNVCGSGRTDSGVHALAQVAHFKVHSPMPIEIIRRALNGNLPPDIAITRVEEVPLDFHAQYSPKSKIYRYTIHNGSVRSALWRRYSLCVSTKLNVASMRREAQYLVGEHDFKSFQASDPVRRNKGSSIRAIHQIKIKKSGDFIFIDIEANGFLYKMVRNIVGCLIAVGQGRLSQGGLKVILEQKDRRCALETARAHGLCLFEVKY